MCLAEEDKHTFRLFFGLSFPFTVKFQAICIIRALTTTTTAAEQQAQHAAAMLSMLSLIKTISQPVEREQIAFHRHFSSFERCSAMFWQHADLAKVSQSRNTYLAAWFSLTSDGCVDIWLAAKAENWVPNSACWVFTYTSAVGLFLTLLVNNISQWNLFGSPLCSYSIQKYSSLFTLVLVFASLKRSLFIALRLSAAPEKYDWDIYVYIVHIHSLTFEINEHSSTPIRHLFSLVVRAGDVPRPNSIQLGS